MKGATILLVLADPCELFGYGVSLQKKGFKTILYNSPGEGINCLESNRVSAVIVGQETPAFEGRQVLEYSLKHNPEIPVLVVARVLNMHYYLEAMDLGAADYLERPKPGDLAWVVETQLRRAKSKKSLPKPSPTSAFRDKTEMRTGTLGANSRGQLATYNDAS